MRPGSIFREEVTAEEFRISMEERQDILGAVESRNSRQHAAPVDGARRAAGDYFVFEFDGGLRAAAECPRAGHSDVGVRRVAGRRHLHHSLTAAPRNLLEPIPVIV